MRSPLSPIPALMMAYRPGMDDILRVEQTARSQALWQHKRDHLRSGRVRPLNDLVGRWRAEAPSRLIPWFDPDDGGVQARTLLLMEAPGPRTVRAGGSGFCSLDNIDGTHRTVRRMLEEVALPRTAVVKWNVVPWAVADAAGQWSAPSRADLVAARDALAQVMALLTRVRLVITMGQPASGGFMAYLTGRTIQRPPVVLAIPHPSQRNTHDRAESELRLRHAFTYALTI